MIQLNLLPDVKKEYLKSQKAKALVISSSIFITLGAVGLVVLLFLYTVLVQQLQITLTTNDIKKKSDELNSIQDIGKYLTVQNQLKVLPELHDQKGVYSRLLNFLPVMNPSPPNNVQLSILNVVSADKSVLFTGTTATFESLNVFVETLNNVQASYKEPGSDQAKTEKIFDSVAVQSSSLGRVNNVSTVTFTIRATYKEAVFDARNTDVNASVPTIQTTSSLNDSPKPQLFDQPQGGQ